MADKTVNELPRASTVTTADLFVLEQAGQAKSLTGQVLINDLAAALDGHGGISDITLNADYTLTITLADETQVTTTSIRGATGAKGDKGTDGRAITSVTKTNTSGLVDTYKIQFSDNTSTNFTVTNGSSIKSIAKTATSGLTDTYTVTLTDNTKSTFTVTNGNGIASIALQSGTHAAGTTDTYKITFDNGQYTTFSVYNGQNGSGAVSTVCSKAPDAAGNVALSADDVGARADTWTPTAADVGARPSTWTPTAEDVGAIPNTDGSVTGDKIANANVTRAKLAQDALYSPLVVMNDAQHIITNDDCGKTFRVGQSTQFVITSENSQALPSGFEMPIIHYGKDTDFNTTIFFDGVPVCAAGERYSTSVQPTIKISDSYSMIAIKKITALDTWFVTGNVEVV